MDVVVQAKGTLAALEASLARIEKYVCKGQLGEEAAATLFCKREETRLAIDVQKSLIESMEEQFDR